MAAVWPKVFSLCYHLRLALGPNCPNHDDGYDGDNREWSLERNLWPYLLQRRQSDVQVTHSSLWKTFGVLALSEESETTTRLLAVVSNLQRDRQMFLFN